MVNRGVRAQRQEPPQAELRHNLTALPGRRGQTERLRAGRRRIELTLCSDYYCLPRPDPLVRGALFIFGTGEKESRLGGSGNAGTCEGAGQLG